jgi:hypothetical protein
MAPMHIVESDHNSLLVECAAGDHLTVFPEFVATGGFQVKPVASRDLLISRFLAGRLMECRFDAPAEKRGIQLHGPDSHGRFIVVHVPDGQAMFIRLESLAAYRLGSQAGFSVSRKLVSPVRWFCGTAFAVIANGPADLIFYGPDLVYTESHDQQQCFAHRLVAFDARTPFRIQGLRPEGHAGTCFDALSSVVDVSFLHSTPLVRRTTVEGKHVGTRLRKAARLVFGSLICGSILEHLLFSRWLWSWIS